MTYLAQSLARIELGKMDFTNNRDHPSFNTWEHTPLGKWLILQVRYGASLLISVIVGDYAVLYGI